MSIIIEHATIDDLDTLTTLINDSYEVETGDTGVAFKKAKRIAIPERDLLPYIQQQRTIKAILNNTIVGTLVYEIMEDKIVIENNTNTVNRLHFGPFAVDPKLQGQGIGKALLTYVYTMAKEKNCVSIDIEVVHLRTDIIPMYIKLGYEKIGEAPFPRPEYTTRECHFVLLRKVL